MESILTKQSCVSVRQHFTSRINCTGDRALHSRLKVESYRLKTKGQKKVLVMDIQMACKTIPHA